MNLVCCPRCSHLMIYRGTGGIAKCSRCMKDMRLERNVGIVPVETGTAPGENRAGRAVPVVDLWNNQPALMLEVWSRDGAHTRLIEIPLPLIGVHPADLLSEGMAQSGRYPVPDAVLTRLAAVMGS